MSPSSPSVAIAIASAPAPFNKPNADLILRTKDDVDFRVHKLILTIASGLFETMFSLPQGQNNENETSQEFVDGLPVIKVEQASRILEILLRFCYPAVVPPINNIKEISTIIEAARFYQMDFVQEMMRERLVSPQILSQKPLHVYTIACSMGWRAEVKDAARMLISTNRLTYPPVYIPEMENITAGDLQRLLFYHEECKRLVLDMTHPAHMSWIPGGDWPWFGKETCINCSNAVWEMHTIGGAKFHYVRTWWSGYIKAIGKKLMKSPNGNAISSPSSERSLLFTKAADCTCAPNVKERLIVFLDMFSTAVDSLTSKLADTMF